MSWNKTTYEGKVCYEQDGQRLFRTQDIDVLEEAERKQAEADREKMKWDRIRYIDECDRAYDGDRIDSGSKQSKTWNVCVIVIVFVVWGLLYFLAMNADKS